MNQDLASLKARRAELQLQKREIRNTLRATRTIGLSSSLVSGGSKLVLAALDAEIIEIDRTMADIRAGRSSAGEPTTPPEVARDERQTAQEALADLLGELDERLTESGVRLFRLRHRTVMVDEPAFAAFLQREIDTAADDASSQAAARRKHSLLDFTHQDTRRLWLIGGGVVLGLIILGRCLGP